MMAMMESRLPLGQCQFGIVDAKSALEDFGAIPKL
jgi:hypothetical protein